MKNIYLPIIFLIVMVCGFYLWSRTTGNNNQEIDSTNQANQNIESESQKNQELEIDVLKQGSGEGAKNGDKVTVHYTGNLEDGTKFDSSLDKGQPFTFTLGVGKVIKGWDLGILGMKTGETRRLTIPSELGYGEIGRPSGSIPPNAVLVFEVVLLTINAD